MVKFTGFSEDDFNSFVLKDAKLLRGVKEKTKSLVKILSKEFGGYFGIYEYRKGRFAGYLSKSADRKNNAFFNFQVNADDLSLEFQIENKDLLFKFLKSIDVKILNDLKKIGDCEIAIWDRNKKVCKFYPDYLDKSNIEFLLNKLKSTEYPIFKFRKIYPRGEAKELLKSPRLIDDMIRSMKIMKVLYDFT
jgi:hypothetical protein